MFTYTIYLLVIWFIGVVWCSGQNKRIAPLSVFHGCINKGLTALTPEIDCDQTAWAYLPSRLQNTAQLSNFGKTWVSQSNVWDTSAAPSGTKREWYVCVNIHKVRIQYKLHS
jgi:hypothetical protein